MEMKFGGRLAAATVKKNNNKKIIIIKGLNWKNVGVTLAVCQGKI